MYVQWINPQIVTPPEHDVWNCECITLLINNNISIKKTYLYYET